jgi:hypothetical protein
MLRNAVRACLAVLAGVAVAGSAQAADPLAVVEAPVEHVDVQKHDGRFVGYLQLTVRNDSRRRGYVTARFRPEQPGAAVDLPGEPNASLVLVHPGTGRPLRNAPPIAPGADRQLAIRATISGEKEPRDLDGRLAVVVRTKSGQPLGHEQLTDLEFREASTSHLTAELIVAILGMVAAAGASLFAGITWWQARKARLPVLSFVVSSWPDAEPDDEYGLEVIVTNSGGGVAAGTRCCVVTPKLVQYGSIGDGTVLPGQQRRVLARGHETGYKGVVFCAMGPSGAIRVWDDRDRAKDIKKPPGSPVAIYELSSGKDATDGRVRHDGFAELPA